MIIIFLIIKNYYKSIKRLFKGFWERAEIDSYKLVAPLSPI
jgi:hypothetical protein